MANCLVTKLKEVVHNDNLAKIGELRMTGTFSNINYVSSTNNGGFTLSLVNPESGVYIQQREGSQATSFDIPANTTFYFTTTGNKKCTLSISEKYNNLQDLRVTAADMTPLSFSDIKYIANLRQLSSEVDATYEQLGTLTTLQQLISDAAAVGGNIEGLKTLVNLKSLEVYKQNVDITGNLATAFGNMTSLTTLTLANTLVAGRIEDFVVAQRHAATPRDTCAGITTKYFRDSPAITWKGSRVATGGTVTLSWAPNSSDNTKTDVTFGDETITIDSHGDIIS